MSICHACDNPRCCNPAHLWLGTALDNRLDARDKGRQRAPVVPSGAGNPNAKLDDAKVAEIKRLIGAGRTNTAIGRQFGVSHATISLIRRGRLWADVT